MHKPLFKYSFYDVFEYNPLLKTKTLPYRYKTIKNKIQNNMKQ